MTPNIYNYEKTEDYARDAAMAIEDFIEWTLQEKKTVSIALSGGKSPLPVYRQLIKNNRIEWDKVELFMVDERYVPLSDERSNFKLIEKEILSKAPLLKAFHPFEVGLAPEKAAEEYEQILESRGKKVFDLVILGMGEDGHTASLFPHSEALKEKIKLATASQSPDEMKRLTITFPAIFSAQKVMFLIKGEEKEHLVKKLVDGKKEKDETKFPAKMVMKHPHVEIYYDQS